MDSDFVRIVKCNFNNKKVLCRLTHMYRQNSTKGQVVLYNQDSQSVTVQRFSPENTFASETTTDSATLSVNLFFFVFVHAINYV